MPLQRKGMEIATFLPIAARKFSLFSYWLVADIWAFPSGFPIPFRNFPDLIFQWIGMVEHIPS